MLSVQALPGASSSKPFSITVIGFYGRGNFGDDLMCEALTRFLIECTEAKVRIVSSNPLTHQSLAGDRVEIIRRTPGAVLRSLRESQVLCQGGGTIFHDSYAGLRLIGYWIKLAMWAVVFWVARLKGAKVVIVGAGIGPLRYPISRWISRLALTACGSIGLRDGASAKTLVDLSSTFRYELGFDLAALHSRHLPVAEENKWKGRKALAISACCLAEFLGGQKLNDRYWWALADALTIFSLEQPVRIVFLSLFTGESSESDDAVADLIAARLPHDLPVDRRSYNGCVEELSAEFERSDWFLCTKYHAALAAYLWGCNFAVITYNRKVSDLADEIGLPLDRRARADMPLPVEVWLEVLRSFAKGNPGGHLLDRHEAKRRARLAVIRVLETAAAQFPNRYAACDV